MFRMLHRVNAFRASKTNLKENWVINPLKETLVRKRWFSLANEMERIQLYEKLDKVERQLLLYSFINKRLELQFKNRPDNQVKDRAVAQQLKTLLKLDNLKMKRILWDSPVIEKICLYEAVHPVKSLWDIKRRFGPDRRVYGLFTDSLANEPLAFIHIALLPDIANNIQSIINSSQVYSPQEFQCAVCYTITTQRAFGSINLGRQLIQSAIESLQKEFPQLKTYATLSPIPAFSTWATDQLDVNRSKLEDYKEILMDMCAQYIVSTNKGRVLDPVANFHFNNGAIPQQIQWKADCSDKGMNESFCMMINYIYECEKMKDRWESYQKKGNVVV